VISSLHLPRTGAGACPVLREPQSSFELYSAKLELHDNPAMRSGIGPVIEVIQTCRINCNASGSACEHYAMRCCASAARR